MSIAVDDASPALAAANPAREKLSALQIWIVLLCSLVLFLDGMNTAAIGFVAPAIATEFAVQRSQLGPLLSAALFGMAAGAFIAGSLADRIGRKPVLIGSVLLFGICTLVCAFVHSMTDLTVLRVVTGLGLGGAIPCAGPLLAEYMPARRRSFFVSVMYCGFPLGASAGGFMAAALIPHFGWPSVFVVGGVLPVILAVCMLILPESLSFLVANNKPLAKIKRVMDRMQAVLPVEPPASGTHVPRNTALGGIGMILARQLVFGTVMLWIGYFMGLLVFYLLTSWLPTILQGAQFSIRDATAIAALMPLGGVIGTIVCGWLLDRFAPYKVTMFTYALGALSLWAAGAWLAYVPVLIATIFTAGFFVIGSQASMLALAIHYYPTACRATGSGWMLGVGRAGGIVGVLAGVPLLHLKLSINTMISILAMPAFVAAIAVGLSGWAFIRRET
ncbi:MFS transporter [Paraburkholderia sediminicola]|uniref:MFS transporter n=1 Tax=Paraburkholderia sediminicola TaxID=458836 RepID=UPI0038BA067D